jgi:hypothetical protein
MRMRLFKNVLHVTPSSSMENEFGQLMNTMFNGTMHHTPHKSLINIVTLHV